MSDEKPIPSKEITLDDLYSEREIAAGNAKMCAILNAPPKEEWIKKHPLVKDLKYIPIEIIEYLLTSLFLKWRVEIKKTELIVNTVVVTVRLHYKDPITNEWDYQDGVGGQPIRTDKGKSPTDFSAVQSSSVQTGVPAAESYAIKDAAEKIGRIFGKDINRKNGMVYDGLKSRFDEEPDLTGFKK